MEAAGFINTGIEKELICSPRVSITAPKASPHRPGMLIMVLS